MLADWLIKKALRESCPKQEIVYAIDDMGHLAWRYMPFWLDEWIDENGKVQNKLPWWRPFNFLIHQWAPEYEDGEREFHDHPRWSITLVLRGEIVEETPWGRKLLKPGSIVIRSRKYIHRLRVAPEWMDKVWTLFIVGPRSHQQNFYDVKPYGVTPG